MLKKICDHPALVSKRAAEYMVRSAVRQQRKKEQRSQGGGGKAGGGWQQKKRRDSLDDFIVDDEESEAEETEEEECEGGWRGVLLAVPHSAGFMARCTVHVFDEPLL